ncbi:MAG: hypothetical protein F4Y99_08805 [Acidimicrobiaceae bacterium]|nr:hypothetical protein [Acidimicrobiaceae bacterium]MYF44741.1 hypothetical protein [Acidimicrobiaceae bacterium]MYJ35730.1 hypothetical protein [Acidimicrobiaceae bacterium]
MTPVRRTGVDQAGSHVVLGLDAGTTSAKAVVVDRAGEILATGGSDPIAVSSTPDGGREQDPEEIWQALATAGRRAVRGLGPGVGVAALAVAAQSGSVIPVTVEGRAERAITWMDTRFWSVPENWSDGVAARVRAVSGWMPTPGVGLSTIVGLQAPGTRQPGADPAPVSRWASVDDYLVFRLTGQWATNPSNAAGMQLMDVTTRTWSDELCSLAGIDGGQLSPIRESGSTAGELAGEAAAALALDAAIPVVIGGHDQACAALGLGVVDPGHLFLSAGTAWVLTAVTDRTDVASLPPSLNLSPHVLGGVWTASENLGGLGAMLAETPPARIQEAFEKCGLKVRQALEEAGEFAAGGDELVMVGGGLRFSELVDVLANIIDRPVVTRPEAAWPALGAARLAAAALGWTPHEGAP